MYNTSLRSTVSVLIQYAYALRELDEQLGALRYTDRIAIFDSRALNVIH